MIFPLGNSILWLNIHIPCLIELAELDNISHEIQKEKIWKSEGTLYGPMLPNQK